MASLGRMICFYLFLLMVPNPALADKSTVVNGFGLVFLYLPFVILIISIIFARIIISLCNLCREKRAKKSSDIETNMDCSNEKKSERKHEVILITSVEQELEPAYEDILEAPCKELECEQGYENIVEDPAEMEDKPPASVEVAEDLSAKQETAPALTDIAEDPAADNKPAADPEDIVKNPSEAPFLVPVADSPKAEQERTPTVAETQISKSSAEEYEMAQMFKDTEIQGDFPEGQTPEDDHVVIEIPEDPTKERETMPYSSSVYKIAPTAAEYDISESSAEEYELAQTVKGSDIEGGFPEGQTPQDANVAIEIPEDPTEEGETVPNSSALYNIARFLNPLSYLGVSFTYYRVDSMDLPNTEIPQNDI